MAEALSRQEIIYAAYAFRVAAQHDEQRGENPTFHSSKSLFESSAKRYRELAEKCERIANGMA